MQAVWVLRLALLSAFCLLALAPASADETSQSQLSVEAALSNAAAKAFEKLGTKITVAVKTVGASGFKIDDGLASQVEATAAATLQKQSAFEAKVVSRATLKQLWAEKSDIENLRADQFGELLKKISADYLELITLRPTDSGTELSVQFLSAHGSTEGQITAATAPVRVDLDIGVVHKKDELVETLKKMSKQIADLSNVGGLVQNPTNYSDFYHNARILSEKGEVDLALQNYEQTLKTPVTFADPILDITTLLTRLYGQDGAKLYLNKKLKGQIPEPLYVFAGQQLADHLTPEAKQYIETRSDLFPPLCALFLEKYRANFVGSTWKDKLLVDKCYKIVQRSFADGSFLAFYIDQLRGQVVQAGIDKEKKLFQLALHLVGDMTESPIVLYFTFNADIPKSRTALGFRIRYFSDSMDLSKPMEVCGAPIDASSTTSNRSAETSESASQQLRRGWLGVETRNLWSDEEKAFGLKFNSGAMVESIRKGSPADIAGIMQGDVIYRFGNHNVSLIDVPEISPEAKIGTKFDVVILRSGKDRVKLTVIAKPDEQPVVQLTAHTEANRICVDLRQFSCGQANHDHCIRFENQPDRGLVGPGDNGNEIDLEKVFKTKCIDTISYVDKDGYDIRSHAKNMTATYERREEYGGSKVLSLIAPCGYKVDTEAQ